MRRSGRSGKQQRRRIGLGGRRPDAEEKLRFAGCRASQLAPLGREVEGVSAVPESCSSEHGEAPRDGKRRRPVS